MVVLEFDESLKVRKFNLFDTRRTHAGDPLAVFAKDTMISDGIRPRFVPLASIETGSAHIFHRTKPKDRVFEYPSR